MKEILKRCLTADENLQLESLEELAKFLNKPLRTLQNWVTRGLPRRRVASRKFVYNLKDVSIWILQNIEGEAVELDGEDPTYKWRLKYACAANEAYELRRILNDLPEVIKSTLKNKASDEVSAVINWLNEQIELYEKKKQQDLGIALRKYDKYLAESDEEK